MARILNIEDDQGIRLLLRVALEEHDVLEAADGEEGLRLAREQAPELILLDLGLPGMHGTKVLSALQSDPALAAVPVIVITAWGEETTARVARQQGATDVIAKPFEVAVLRERVAAALA